MTRVEVSVVIGFRDWGIDRLRRSVRSIQRAVGGLAAEVLISDYGSRDPSLAADVASTSGARHLFTPGDAVWSRSRALNAGFSVAEGRLFIATDADMIFSPGAIEAIFEESAASAPAALVLQCRDLPESIPAEIYDDLESLPWDELERRSTLRPRWGMGGMMAIDRDGFAHLNGFDERLHTYGREDIDFVLRARRAGYRTAWVQDQRARMYHMWHPQTQQVVSSTTAGREAIAQNRRLVDNDETTTRNVGHKRSLVRGGGPLVTALILGSATHDARYRTVATTLSQSVQNLEVLVADESAIDMSTVPSDPRLHTLSNVAQRDSLREGAANSRGTYLTILRAGSILGLQAVENLLHTIPEGACGVVGAVIAVGNDGTRVTNPADGNRDVLLVRADVARAVMASGAHVSNVTDLMTLLERAGYALGRTKNPVSVLPMMDSIGTGQPIGPEEGESLSLLLPDEVNSHGRNAVLAHLDDPAALSSLDGEVDFAEASYAGEVVCSNAAVNGASYSDLIVLARAGTGLSVTGGEVHIRGAEGGWLGAIVGHARRNGLGDVIKVERSEATSGTHDGYVVRHPSGETVLTISDLEKGERAGTKTWLVIGAQIDEVWP